MSNQITKVVEGLSSCINDYEEQLLDCSGIEIRDSINEGIANLHAGIELCQKNKAMQKVLKHILKEQLDHGDHGDAQYIRMIEEALHTGEVTPEESFEEKYYSLCEEHDKCVSGCCMIGFDKLSTCFAIDNEGDELHGLPAHKKRLEEE